VLAFDKGDQPVEALASFARDQRLDAAHFTGIGAFSDLRLSLDDESDRCVRSVKGR
jgi:predicted DNA-binding protein with PD1-like motif